jgi:hypothetical protein
VPDSTAFGAPALEVVADGLHGDGVQGEDSVSAGRLGLGVLGVPVDDDAGHGRGDSGGLEVEVLLTDACQLRVA